MKIDYGDNQVSDMSPLSHLQQLEQIDCGDNQISDLSSLLQLQQLTKLDCEWNYISDLSPISKLSKLTQVECGFNKISDLSPLSQLHQLTQIHCAGNQVSDLLPLSELQHLTQISCGGNQISDLSPLANMHQLTRIDCVDNQISDLSPLSQLQQLSQLQFDRNKISSIAIIYPFIMNDAYKHLSLYGNPLSGIPQELLGDEFYENCQEELKNYFLDQEKGKTLKQQIKVQFLGNGRVGKSTLAYALEHKTPPDESFKETHGIVIKEIEFTVDALEDPVSVQLWDFGGQEIYHATHRLFLSPDSLYLLLWAEDTNECESEVRHPVSYWLEAIHDLASDSPIILIKNQIDRSDHLPIEPVELSSDTPGFAQVKQAVKISAMKYKGMPVLRGAIEEVLGELKDKLQIVLPTSWLDITRELDARRNRKSIPFAHFQQLCIKAGVNDAAVLADYLHKTGVVFYKPDAFQDQMILDQNWAIDAVYCLFDPNGKRDLVERMGGHFNGDELELCLKSIQRKFSQLTYWDDRQIFAGELVDTQIFERLEPADIVVLLISRNFFASDYCFSIEMEKALQQFEQGNNIVIPIIIRDTADWHDFDIGKLTALPTDGKPLSQWDDDDAFWADVQTGIRRQVEKRLASH